MHNLTDVFQLIVDGLNQGTLAQEQLVLKAHHAISHVPADFGEEFEPLVEEYVMQSLREIASVPKELSPESSGESRHGLAVVNMAGRQPKGQQFALVVDDKMSCEAEEPPHGRLAPHGKACEDFMRRNAVIVTRREGRRVDEGNPRAAAFAGVEIVTQWPERSGHK